MDSNNIIDEIRSMCNNSCGEPSDLFNKKWQNLKDCNLYNNIIRGSELGLTAYQKPRGGIPKSDLSLDLQQLLSNLESLCGGSGGSSAFGIVSYNKITKKINFYAPGDNQLTRILGSIDVNDLPKGPRGPQGPKGEKGDEGTPPTLTIVNGMWYINGEPTNQPARGEGITDEVIEQLNKLDETAGLVDYLIQLTQNSYPHSFKEKTEFDALLNSGRLLQNVIYLVYEDD